MFTIHVRVMFTTHVQVMFTSLVHLMVTSLVDGAWRVTRWARWLIGSGLRRWISERGWDGAGHLLSAAALAIAFTANDQGVSMMSEPIESSAGQ